MTELYTAAQVMLLPVALIVSVAAFGLMVKTFVCIMSSDFISAVSSITWVFVCYVLLLGYVMIPGGLG